MSQRGVAGRRERSIALGASVAFHVLLLLVLARFLAQTPQPAEAPVMQVTLEALQARTQESPEPRHEVDRERRMETSTARATSLPTDLPVAPRIEPPGDAAVAGLAQQALQGLAGCERPGLSREARERCQTRQWAAVAPGPSRLNLDLSGRYAENPEPFLSRRPTKGCRVRATGDVDAMGDSGAARAGVTCVIPF